MAGRPRTMAKRVTKLYDAFAAIAQELEKLMPDQYQKPTTDALGQAWQRVDHALDEADECFFDLICDLEAKALRAKERAAASVVVVEPGGAGEEAKNGV